MFNMRIIEVLDAKMTTLGLNSTDLAVKTGVTTSTIQKIRSGINENPTITNLLKIADYLNITVSELIGEVDFSSYQKIPLIEWSNLQAINEAEHENFLYIKDGHTGCFAVEIEQNLGKIDGVGVVIVNPAVKFKNNNLVLVLKDNIKVPAIKKIIVEGSDSFLMSLNPEHSNLEPLTPNYLIIGVVTKYNINFK